MAELDFSQQVSGASVMGAVGPRVLPAFGELTCPHHVPLRTSMAWRWWAEGSPSHLSPWRRAWCLKRARRTFQKTMTSEWGGQWPQSAKGRFPPGAWQSPWIWIARPGVCELHVARQCHRQRPRSLASPYRDICPGHGDAAPMPILGPSLLFCGKPACWVRGHNPQDKVEAFTVTPWGWGAVQSKVTSAVTRSQAVSCLHFYLVTHLVRLKMATATLPQARGIKSHGWRARIISSPVCTQFPSR